MFAEKSLSLLYQSFPILAKSAFVTLQIAAVALFIGMSCGVLFGILNCHKLRYKQVALCIDTFVWMIRGTPLFVQLLIVYFAVPDITGIPLSPFAAGVIALGINATAYISEIVRGGIDAILDSQWDAAYILGYRKSQTLTYIILPQMFKNSLPSLTNELTTIIKETSILMMIGVAELTKASKDIVARELDPMTIYLAAAGLYLLMTSGAAFAAQCMQRRLQHD